jgi:hypothetical protein
MPHSRPLALLTLLAVLMGVAAATSACGGAAGAADHGHAMAPLDPMPAEVRQAPVVVREAYQFAVGNPDLMQQIPCYCGCGAMGHTSNYSCYVAEVAADGTITYDTHALGCSLCVDITQDAMRLLKQGKSPGEIRAYVDGKYAKYGPSNIP